LDDGRIVEWPHDQPTPDGALMSLQRTEDPGSAPAGAPANAVAAETASANSPSAPTAAPSQPAPGRTEAEIDQLCQDLYAPLRRRLCRDLLLDRERAGYRTDIRY
jgi:hypothetical protein